MSASTRPAATPPNASRRYLNVVLTANALLLGVLALHAMGLSFTSDALAQTSSPRSNDADDGGRISAAEQRKTMIAQLSTLTQKVERMEHVLSRGVNVRVVEMPAGFAGGKGEGKGEGKPKDDKSESKSEVRATKAPDAPAKK